MNKKLIITEEQYKNLKFFLLESTFDVMANKVIQKGDNIIITTQGKKLNFEVVENTNGQIFMDVIDQNSDYFGRRAFLTMNSFNDNKLQLNLSSDKQKEEKPPQVKTWAKWTLKDVEKIDVYRGGKIIDGTNIDGKSEEGAEEGSKRKSRFLEAIATLNNGDAISLETNGKIGNVVLNFMSKSSGFVHFELSEKTKDALGNPNITGIDISLDESHIEETQNGLLTIDIITYETKDGNVDKNQSKIQNIADFTVSNSEDENDSEDEKDSNNEDDEKRKSRFIETLSTLEEGDAIDLSISGRDDSIILDFMSKSNGFVNFELSEKTKDALGNPNITGVDFPLDENKIEVTKEGTLNVDVITYETKDGDIQKREEKIQNIKDVNVVDATNIDTDTDTDKKEESQLDGQKIFDIITGDTQLRNAFYKKPSFWRSFTAELKGEKPKTTGYTYVQNLLNNYMDDASSKKLGKNFLHQGAISFRPLEEVTLKWTENKKNRIMTLNSNNITTVNWKRSEPSEEGGDYYTLLQSKEFDILVKEKGDKPNTYICDIFKRYQTTKTDDEGKRNKKIVRSEPAEDIMVEFLKSPGYRLDKQEDKNK